MKLIDSLKNIGNRSAVAFSALLVFVLACFYLAVFGRIIAPLSPLVTMAFVLLGTVLSVNKRETRVMAIGGIILYVLSWKAATLWGTYMGLAVCGAGIILWLQALINAIEVRLAPMCSFRV